MPPCTHPPILNYQHPTPQVASRMILSYRRAYVGAYDLLVVKYDPLATEGIRGRGRVVRGDRTERDEAFVE